jgi:Xaa-Pro dipeptidase
MGPIKNRAEWQAHYHVDQVMYTDGLDEYFESLQSPEPILLLVLDGMNSDSDKRYDAPTLPASVSAKKALVVDTSTLFAHMAECRVIKSAAEQQVLRYVTEVTSYAHA